MLAERCDPALAAAVDACGAGAGLGVGGAAGAGAGATGGFELEELRDTLQRLARRWERHSLEDARAADTIARDEPATAGSVLELDDPATPAGHEHEHLNAEGFLPARQRGLLTMVADLEQTREVSRPAADALRHLAFKQDPVLLVRVFLLACCLVAAASSAFFR